MPNGPAHRLQGIVFLKGLPFLRQAHLENAHILDLAPTLCYLLDVPIPDDFDGQVLSQAFEQTYLESHRLNTQQAPQTIRTKAEATYTPMNRIK